MKKIITYVFLLILLVFLSSCRSVYRVYNDEDLSDMAKRDYGFSEVLTFKIVGSNTAFELTGETYNNSGVIIGIKSGVYEMVFVPKMAAEEPFLLELSFDFNLRQIYDDLRVIDQRSETVREFDFFADYGALSITIDPYELVVEENPSLSFDSKVFFVVTTDEVVYYVGFVDGDYTIFDADYAVIT